MHRCYSDILGKGIGDEPRWFDEHGVPRFCAFSPNECADIYAREAALVEIRCQSCGHPFRVAITRSSSSSRGGPFTNFLVDRIRGKELHYGDPPNIGCCDDGPTISSEPRRVIEYWEKSSVPFKWTRDSSLEVDIAW